MTDDRTLVSRFQAGDERAFDELVGKYASRAYQIAYGILGNREDAQEVAEDVFIRIHKSLASFRGESEFTTWMYRIAQNLARNKYRWNKVRKQKQHVSLDAPIEGEDNDEQKLELPDSHFAPDEQTAYTELEECLARELQNIPEVFRMPLVMSNIDEMSYEEIADVLDCKIGTVKSRIARARAMLKERLGL
ncbi:MAG: sigma-70 family RNA polymerase sigma factor [Victivallales bacterium]|nr:sigma-70 family RNA polymerase sigma factor [Victivallales bacterium]